jgi:four helix bundle protein
MRDFRKLEIWKDSILYCQSIYKYVKYLPEDEKYGLVMQMKRAVVSIPSNIAEGCRGTNKELRHFINIALGSSFELETQIEITKLISNIGPKESNDLISELNSLQKRINAFRNSIKLKTKD